MEYDLLHRYMQMEPSFKFNAEIYLVSMTEGKRFLVFLAVCRETVCGIVMVTKETFELITTGTAMAYLYDSVLCDLEKCVAKGKDMGDLVAAALMA